MIFLTVESLSFLTFKGPGHRCYRFIFTLQNHTQQETKLWDQGAQGKLQVWQWDSWRGFWENLCLWEYQFKQSTVTGDFSFINFFIPTREKRKPKNEWDIQRLGELFERTGKTTRKYLEQVKICNPATGNKIPEPAAWAPGENSLEM